MLDLTRLAAARLQTEPYRWAAVDRLFSAPQAAALAAEFPREGFKHVVAYEEKESDYQIRCLLRMDGTIAAADRLSAAWRALAADFASPAYRAALATLTGLDLRQAPLEINVFRYPPGASLGAHPDHRDKQVSHILYFNEAWDEADGGCLSILGSADPGDVVRTISPLVGNSVVLVRSDDSWHAVSRVAERCRRARLSVVATFYQPGCVSSVWPSWRRRLLHDWPLRAWHRLKAAFGA